MTITPITRCLVALDKTADVLPIVSTITNLAALILKSVIPSTTTNHYFTHIKDKSALRCFVLLFPAIGNLCVVLYDLLKKSPAVPVEPPQIDLPAKRPSLSITVPIGMGLRKSSSPIPIFSPARPAAAGSVSAPQPNSARNRAEEASAIRLASDDISSLGSLESDGESMYDRDECKADKPEVVLATHSSDEEDYADFDSLGLALDPTLAAAGSGGSTLEDLAKLELSYIELVAANPAIAKALPAQLPQELRSSKALFKALIDPVQLKKNPVDLDILKHFKLKDDQEDLDTYQKFLLRMLKLQPHLNLGSTNTGTKVLYIEAESMDDENFVQAAMRSGSMVAFAFASDRVRADKQTARLSLELTGRLAKYIPDQVKRDPEVAEAIAAQPGGFEHLPRDLKRDPELRDLAQAALPSGLILPSASS